MIIPIVTLDKIYIRVDDENIYYLDCTRIDNSSEIISRKQISLDKQIILLASMIKSREIILADDVVFSGSVLRNIISKFNNLGIKVVGIISSICTNSSYNYFNQYLKYGIRCNYILSDNVIDQICERDFYFGIAGSGIMIKTDSGLYKAPYFIPFGSPNERASIPIEYEKIFSLGCIDRSIYMWEEIDKLRDNNTLISELPEKIINTTKESEVVKVLKKERRNI